MENNGLLVDIHIRIDRHVNIPVFSLIYDRLLASSFDEHEHHSQKDSKIVLNAVSKLSQVAAEKRHRVLCACACVCMEPVKKFHPSDEVSGPFYT